MSTRDPDFESPPPNAAEAERAVLGHILLDNRLMDQALTLIPQPDRFYVPSHRKVFIAMMALHERRAEINPVLINQELKKDHASESVGGISFITDLSYGLPHTSNLSNYTDAINDTWTRRWIIKESLKNVKQAYDLEDTTPDIVNGVIERFSSVKEKIATKDQRGGAINEIKELVIDYLYTVKAGINPAIPTAFSTLDRLTGGGVQLGEMRGVAALSSRGKTSMLLQDLRESAKRGDASMLFSLEMKSQLIALRCLTAETGVPLKAIRVGMPDTQIDYLVDYVQKGLSYPLWIYNDCRSVQDIHARIRWFKRQHPTLALKRVGIDYYGKLSGYGKGRDRYENRTQELKYIADYLQQEIAIGENVALDVPAQFNRSAWGAKEPGPANIDGGEAYYHACDLFAVLHTEMDKALPGDKTVKASLAVYKQRNGPTAVGKEKLKYMFHREKMEFYPALEDEGEAEEPAPETSQYL